MIGILNYRAGNLKNLKNALDFIQVESIILDSAKEIKKVDKIILPGVGSFGHAIKNLRQYDFENPLLEWIKSEKPLLGICVGMQLLFSKSTEDGIHKGLNIFQGKVTRFNNNQQKVPQIGWNTVAFQSNNLLFKDIENHSWFYFVHSYACHPKNNMFEIGNTSYGNSFCSIVHHKNIWGVQFHPEKSQSAGLQILKNFATLLPLQL